MGYYHEWNWRYTIGGFGESGINWCWNNEIGVLFWQIVKKHFTRTWTLWSLLCIVLWYYSAHSKIDYRNVNAWAALVHTSTGTAPLLFACVCVKIFWLFVQKGKVTLVTFKNIFDNQYYVQNNLFTHIKLGLSEN